MRGSSIRISRGVARLAVCGACILLVSPVGCASGSGASATGSSASGSGASATGADGSPGDAGAGTAAVDAASGCEEAGALEWALPACASCTNANCCAVESSCAAIDACAPLNQCSQACGADAGCKSQCASTYIAATSNYNAILNCQNDSCAAACGP